MSQENANIHVAMGSVVASAAGVGGTPIYNFAKGFQSPNGLNPTASGAGAHTVVGQYDLLLDTPLDLVNSTVQVTAKTAVANPGVFYSRPDVNTIRVNTTAAGVAADTISFDVMIHAPPAG